MLKILPIYSIILYSHIITYQLFLVIFIVSVIIMSTIATHIVTIILYGEQDIASAESADFSSEST